MPDFFKRSSAPAILLLVLFGFGSTSCSQLQDVFTAFPKTPPRAQVRTDSAGGKSEDKPLAVQTAANNPVDLSVSEALPTVSSGPREPIFTQKGIYYFVVEGDTLAKIAGQYKMEKEQLAQINDLFDGELVVGRRLFIPAKKNRRDYLSVTNLIKEKKIVMDKSTQPINFIWPLEQYVFTSGFGLRRGRQHDGIDLSAKVGTPVYAAAEGTVIFAKKFAGYGYLLVLKHAGNYFSAYAHCSELFVDVDKKVKKGQKIALVGRTGRSTGPHLHFEVHKGAQAINPLKVLPKGK